MVECDLAKVEVAGSNPVSRSIRLRRCRRRSGYGEMSRRSGEAAKADNLRSASYRSVLIGAVAKW